MRRVSAPAGRHTRVSYARRLFPWVGGKAAPWLAGSGRGAASFVTMASPEFALHCAVADLLRICLPNDILWSHLPFGEARTKRTAGRLKAMGVTPGWPDFLILGPGGPVFIEIKAKGQRLSAAQAEWHRKAQALGYIVYLARAIEDVQAILRRHGLTRRARAPKSPTVGRRWSATANTLPTPRIARPSANR